jgi:radical SAM protein with 4Fe4S-binding SPASM domain
MQAIEFLHKQNIRTILKTTVTNQNFPELKHIGKIAKKFGCFQVATPVIGAKNNGDKSSFVFRLDDRDMRDFYLSAFKRIPRQKKEYESHAGEAMINCRSGRTGFCINPVGEVYPCVGFPVSVGSLRKKSFKEIWDSSNFLKKIRKQDLEALPECSQCTLLSLCMRCKGMAYVEDGDILGPSKEACRIAKIVKEVAGK